MVLLLRRKQYEGVRVTFEDNLIDIILTEMGNKEPGKDREVLLHISPSDRTDGIEALLRENEELDMQRTMDSLYYPVPLKIILIHETYPKKQSVLLGFDAPKEQVNILRALYNEDYSFLGYQAKNLRPKQ
ncbi:MAG: hypothetical protein AABW41_02380 [Nanoarchaeota archaeon]